MGKGVFSLNLLFSFVKVTLNQLRTSALRATTVPTEPAGTGNLALMERTVTNNDLKESKTAHLVTLVISAVESTWQLPLTNAVPGSTACPVQQPLIHWWPTWPSALPSMNTLPLEISVQGVTSVRREVICTKVQETPWKLLSVFLSFFLFAVVSFGLEMGVEFRIYICWSLKVRCVCGQVIPPPPLDKKKQITTSIISGGALCTHICLLLLCHLIRAFVTIV